MSEPPIRVLVVDDSAVIRRLVSEILNGEEGIEVAGVAEHGRRGIDRIEQVDPDVVILDIEMPVLDGLGALSEIRPRWPRLPVIMFSTLTERGATATLRALGAGANDYVTKPTGLQDLAHAKERVADSMVPLVRHWGRLARSRPKSSRVLEVRPQQPDREAAAAVVIGSSTGGPVALTSIVPELPRILTAPILVVQHMPTVFTRMLAERLNDRSPLAVVEARDGAEATPGSVFVAPGGRHLTVRRRNTKVEIGLNDDPPENSCRPSVDVLFRSAAEVWGPGVLAVVLTGMGQDGLVGSRHIVETGGSVIVQDEHTSVVWGMPGAVAAAGLAEEVLPLTDIAGAIERRAQHESKKRRVS